MPGAHGNQPTSTGSNYNQSKYAKDKAPKRNKEVKYQKHKKHGKEYQKVVDNKQAKMINRLSRQVYKLQMKSYGKVQQNFHLMSTTGSGADNEILVNADRPVCLDLTDFTCERGPEVAGLPSIEGANIFQLAPPAAAPSRVANWIRKPIDSVYGDNIYWEHQNADRPDTGAYLAMNATYFVEIKGVPYTDNTRVRFDVISQKPNAILPATAIQGPATPLPKLLPDTLRYMKDLADPTKNRINPTYFHKYMSKTVFLNSSKSEDTKGTTANVMRFSFKIHPNKLCIQSQTNPQVGGGIVISEDPPPDDGEQEEFSRGNFGPRNVPATQPLWLLISSDAPGGSPPPEYRIAVSLSRRVVWRDHIGSSQL